MDDKVVKWRRWIERIVRDVRIAVSDRRIWREVRAAWSANPSLRVRTDLPRWIARMHSGSAALTVRRQLDIDRQSVSLKRLLTELSTHPDPRLTRPMLPAAPRKRRGGHPPP